MQQYISKKHFQALNVCFMEIEPHENARVEMLNQNALKVNSLLVFLFHPPF